MSPSVTETVTVENQISLFFHNHKLGELLRQSNIRKDKGVSIDALFQFLLTVAFTGKNLFRLFAAPDTANIPSGIGKDVVYRFFNCVSSNWRKFLLLLSTRVIVQKLLPLTDDATKKVLIADDTLYPRDRSKCVELLARSQHQQVSARLQDAHFGLVGWQQFHPDALLHAQLCQ